MPIKALEYDLRQAWFKYVIMSCRSADSHKDNPMALFPSMSGFVYRYWSFATKGLQRCTPVDFGIYRTNEHEATNIYEVRKKH
jgi:hypothetical protein